MIKLISLVLSFALIFTSVAPSYAQALPQTSAHEEQWVRSLEKGLDYANLEAARKQAAAEQAQKESQGMLWNGGGYDLLSYGGLRER